MTYLKTGHNWAGAATGPMPETLHLSTSRMTEDDLNAIAAYLKDPPGQAQVASTTPDHATMNAGAQIYYADACPGGHAANGEGSLDICPSLRASAQVQQSDPTSPLSTCGSAWRAQRGNDKAPTASAMPAFSWVLGDNQIAAVLTYIRNTCDNSAPPVSADDVCEERQALGERND